MATSESDFKAGFKRDLIEAYPSALIWTNSDMFRAGLPDLSVSREQAFYAIELKFVGKLPKRGESKCLRHEVTPAQVEFLNKNIANGNYSCVLIGLKDVVAVMYECKQNYTLKEVLTATRVSRVKGRWVVDSFFETMGPR